MRHTRLATLAFLTWAGMTLASCADTPDRQITPPPETCDPEQCDDGNPCTFDYCKDGQCVFPNKPPGTSCADDDPCNGEEMCDGEGHCAPQEPMDCSDDDPCTADGCDSETGECTHEAVDGCCTDDDQCGEGLTCDPEGHRCVPSQECQEDQDCVVYDPCQRGVCDPETHTCSFEAIDGCCSDDGQCGEGMTCDEQTHRCVPSEGCQSDQDCVSDDPCMSGTCDQEDHTCSFEAIEGCCTDDGQCGEGMTCDVEEHRCVPSEGCQSDQDCVSDDPCMSGTCDQEDHTCSFEAIEGCCREDGDCVSDDPCLVGSCDPETHRCGFELDPDCGGTDADNDGWPEDQDCDDHDPALNLDDADHDGATTCDGDCDDNDASLNLDDLDRDGFSTCDGDCDDADGTLTPADADHDGFSTCDGDCDDSEPAAYPGASVVCGDGIDNDCDGQTDDPVNECPIQVTLLINEVYYDQPSTDGSEVFIELWGEPAGAPLVGFVLERYRGNGSRNGSVDLGDLTLGDDGYLLVADPDASAELAAMADVLSNVADGVNTSQNLVLKHDGEVVDALAYGDVTENMGEGSPAPDVPAGHSLTRDPDHTDTDDNSVDFSDSATPTPRAEPAPAVIGYAAIQWPRTPVAVDAGQPSELVFGRVFVAGRTEGGGQGQGIEAQLCYGPDGTDPELWDPRACADAEYNGDLENDLGELNDDEYRASLTVDEPGTYDFAYRFRVDGGRWVWADMGPEGTTDGYSPDTAGELVVGGCVDDADQDGSPCSVDCDDDDPDVHPGAEEICDNGKDDDCDGLTDGEDLEDCQEAPAVVLINEILYDDPGSDGEDVFIELWGPAGQSLDGYSLAQYGRDGREVSRLDLAGRVIGDDGFFLVAHPDANQDLAAAADLLDGFVDLRNSAASLRLEFGGQAVDALSWGSVDVNLGEGSPAPDVTAGHSLTRDADHTDTGDNSVDFTDSDSPTPGADALGSGIGYAAIQFPTDPVTICQGQDTPMIFGRVYVEGVTPVQGQGEGVVAQLGYGPVGSDPARDAGWTWIDAGFNGDLGNDDEYVAIIETPAVGTHDVAYRFSYQDRPWEYADLGPMGTTNGYDTPLSLTVLEDCNLDVDQDGAFADQDCDDSDPNLNLDDSDQDGFSTCDGDCDDGDAEVNPDAVEVCDNGRDDDCDGKVDGEDMDCVEPPGILVSEVLYDDEGVDGEDLFLELAGPPSASLEGMALVRFDARGEEAGTLSLDGMTMGEDGFFLVVHPSARPELSDMADLVDRWVDLPNSGGSVRLVMGDEVLDAVAWGTVVSRGEGDPAADVPAGHSLTRDGRLTDTDENSLDFSDSPVPNPRALPPLELLVDRARIQFPIEPVEVIAGQETPAIYGRVFMQGVTEGEGRGDGIVAELGYGPDGSQPGDDWTWVRAEYFGDVGEDDSYEAALVVDQPGEYDFAYRFSYQGGPWVYGDRDGSEDGYAPEDAGSLVVREQVVDQDGDGAPAGRDCDDTDPALNLDDADGDGFSTCAGDCDDHDQAVNPAARELCDNRVDDDCDGATDQDDPQCAALLVNEILVDDQGTDGEGVFIELWSPNHGGTLDGVALEYYSSSGRKRWTLDLSGHALGDDGFFLIVHPSAEPGLADLADLVTDRADLTNTGGSLRLVAGDEVLDALAYGAVTVSLGEGAAAARPGTDRSLTRDASHRDTDDNAADFSVTEHPTPRGDPRSGVDWAAIQHPLEPMVVDEGRIAGPVFGRVYVAGRTEGEGRGEGVEAQLGWGPVGTMPDGDGWTWVDATYDGDLVNDLGELNDDEYVASLEGVPAGQWDVAYRFRIDGSPWTYADELPAGTSDGYHPEDAGRLVVQVQDQDQDGDGYTADVDCDDTDASLNRDDLDQDGFSTCDGDCDDEDPTLTPADRDEDGFSTCDGDCDDEDPSLTPADRDGDGSSTCDGDCDDGDETLTPADEDGDGFSTCAGDCDDRDGARHPGAVEDCGNGVDDDCDGLVDGDDPACQEPPAVVINEVLYDDPGTDGEDLFVELAGPAGAALDGLTLVFLKADGTERGAFPLDGLSLDERGFGLLVDPDAREDLAAAAMASDALVDMPNKGGALRLTAGERVIDALAYGTADPALGEGDPAPDAPAGSSLTRDAGHTDTGDNSADFSVTDGPTPGGDPAATTIGWAAIQWPVDPQTVDAGEAITYYGRVYVEGITEAQGQGEGLVAQAGYGPEGTPPDGRAWTWVDAAYSRDLENDDEYAATLEQVPEGRWSVVFRFSRNRGPWVYADLPPGTDDGFSTDHMALLVIRGQPRDQDGDGFPADVDCDDTDPALNLDDADGDGFSTCDGDCDDQDPASTPADLDEDGQSTCAGDCDDQDPAMYGMDLDEDGVSPCEGDCDDQDPGVSPDAAEDCGNGVDDDCDGLVDGDDPECGPPAAIVINEILYDDEGADGEEVFIELWGPAGAALDGYSLVRYSGRGNITGVLDLAGQAIGRDGFWLVADEAAAQELASKADLLDGFADLPNTSGSLALMRGEQVVDALAWGSPDEGKGEGDPAPDAATGHSLTRDAAHTDTDDNSADFSETDVPTPRANPAALTIGYAAIQFPVEPVMVAPGAETPLIFGRVYVAGGTEGEGRFAGIVAQVGYGPDGTDPAGPGWSWQDAQYNRDLANDQGQLNDDEYRATLTINRAGEYDVAYRFSLNGLQWVYADLGPAGTTDGYDPGTSLTLVVTEDLVDADGDGAPAGQDCDDQDPALNLSDADEDGFSTCAGDCDDQDPALNPTDADEDGFSSCAGDCDDRDAARFPGAQEDCGNGVDDDCDGLTDRDDPFCRDVPRVVISEVLYDDEGADGEELFIELHGEAGVRLDDMALETYRRDGTPISSLTLDGMALGDDGFFLVVHPSATDELARMADLRAELVDLPNTGGALRLVRAGVVLDALAYGGAQAGLGEGEPAADVDSGHSLSRDGEFTDTDDNATDFTETEDPSPRGAPVVSVIGYAAIHSPGDAVELQEGQQGPEVSGRVYVEGLTEPDGPGEGIRAQLGYGPDGTDPATGDGWTWVDAAYRGQLGNDDEYVVRIPALAPGRYDLAYRFSLNGIDWVYADLAPQGTLDGYHPDTTLSLVVTPVAVDADQDGWVEGVDCDDQDPALNLDDADEDGFSTCAGDCDDHDQDMSPADRDGDGFGTCDGDCDDLDALVAPDAAEDCGNGVDDDCDGLVDGDDPECLPPPAVVINEVYYDAPGADAPHVFIELWGEPGVNLDGLNLVRFSAAGNPTAALSLDGASIGLDGFFLLVHDDATEDLMALADGSSSFVDLPNTGGSLVLARGDFVIDALGYGDVDVSYGEGEAAADAPAGSSLSRDARHTDTDENAVDFVVGPPTPRQDPSDRTIGWAAIQWPEGEIVIQAGNETPLLFGVVYVEGSTDSDGQGEGVFAQVGYGPDGSDPSSDAWTWIDGVYNGDLDGGANDEYRASLQDVPPGTWDWAWRFSLDRVHWVYADARPGGSGDGYDPQTAGSLVVEAPPVDQDGDGYPAGQDCDDTDPDMNLDDADGDLASTCDGDCDDQDPELDPWDLDDDGASTCDGDCDDQDPDLNLLDVDEDGFSTCAGDCDDLEPGVNPDAAEDCGNGVDDDCDGLTDQDDPDCQAPPAVVISELCYDDPGADGEQVLIELHGDPGASLAGFTMERYSRSGDLDGAYDLGGLSLGDDGFLLMVAAAAEPDLARLADVVEPGSFPDLPNTGGALVLLHRGRVVDALAYGAADHGEGEPAADVPVGHCLSRDAGFTDTDDNAADFLDEPAPTPRAAYSPMAIGYAAIQFPVDPIEIQAGEATPLVFGRVYVAGLTEADGPGEGIIAQLGYGPDGTDPAAGVAWTWVDARYNGQLGNDDEYMATLDGVPAGTWDLAYRFSLDGAVWVYADLGPGGTDDGYDPVDSLSLVVAPPPAQDQDRDGWVEGVDCDDQDPALNLDDADGDGFSTCDGDCDDQDPALNLADADEDGVSTCGGDCDDQDPNVSPALPEDCDNGVDDDCDLLADQADPECAPLPDVVISEVLYDDEGADGEDVFIELHGPAGAALDGITLATYRGDGTVLAALPLDGLSIGDDGFFLVAHTAANQALAAVADVLDDMADMPNSAGSVELIARDSTLDGLSYGDVDLGLEGDPAPDVPTGRSLTRDAIFTDTDDNRLDFAEAPPSPRAPYTAKTIGWAALNWPVEPIAIRQGEVAGPVFGRVYVAGLTEAQGQGQGIVAQAGYAALDAGDPPEAWTWVDAAYNGDLGNDDEYRADLAGLAQGDYVVAFRFSLNGIDWVYADLAPEGTDDGFSVDDCLLLEVAEPPPVDADGDGYPVGQDCDDSDPALNLDDADGDLASTCDGDCDDQDAGLDPWDLDDDGASTCDGDCDDQDPDLNLLDVDEDGFTTCGGDCDDLEPGVNPDAAEDCGNGRDDDCDGLTDDDDPDCADVPWVFISEILYDDPGEDGDLVFIELGGDPGASLDGFSLVAYRGNGDPIAALSLDGATLDQDGRFVVVHPDATDALMEVADGISEFVDLPNTGGVLQLVVRGGLADQLLYGQVDEPDSWGGVPAADVDSGHSLCRVDHTGDASVDFADTKWASPHQDCILHDIGWAAVQWPLGEVTIQAGDDTPIYYGRVYVEGITDGPGQGEGVLAELGVGPDGSDPASDPWVWETALFNVDQGNDDEYAAWISDLLPGRYDVAFRFSLNRIQWVYADERPMGSSDGYSPDDAGDLLVAARPDDADGDGYTADVDCDDSDPAMNWDDADRDGASTCEGDCNDQVEGLNLLDLDEDGVTSCGGDCDDEDPDVSPDEVEVCDNGKDDDCDGLVDGDDPDCRQQDVPMVISEVRYDDPGTDGEDIFIELHGPAGASLDGYRLVSYGRTGAQRAELVLDGAAFGQDGFFLVAHPDAAQYLADLADVLDVIADMVNSGGALQLLHGDEVVDALAYGNQDQALGLGEGAVAADADANHSLTRDAQLTDTDDNASDFHLSDQPTPRGL